MATPQPLTSAAILLSSPTTQPLVETDAEGQAARPKRRHATRVAEVATAEELSFLSKEARMHRCPATAAKVAK